jgi:predicted transcriptional regulator
MTDKKIISLRLEAETVNKLNEVAAKERTSKASIIRRALDLFWKHSINQQTHSSIAQSKAADMEKKFYTLVNKTNILARQVEELQRKQKHE